jgi:tRNA(Ile2)-agmatinylcytidine synthase
MIAMHVGIDDTDSPRMGCTTYIAALLVEKLRKIGVVFVDYPNLVRLNPNVPWKTRGNGALCLRFQCSESLVEDIKSLVVDVVEENSDMAHARTEPGIVFFFGDYIPRELTVFAEQTIQGVVKMRDTLRLVRKFGAEAVGFKSERGIIGALAAVGETLEGDYTYELITYRTPENRGTQRRLDVDSVKEMDEKTAPLTFNNFDSETGRVLITPHGPDPIFYGIRGETAAAVKRAHKIVRALEPIERWMIFRTNHGTDAHLRKVNSISEVTSYQSIIVKGTVTEKPRIIPRRHVIFSISDETGQIDCAAYEPTGALQKAARQLIVGDRLEVYGGIRPASSKHGVTVNLEKFQVLGLASKRVFHNPLCPKCGKRMKSMGKGQGFRCDKCGLRERTLKKVVLEVERGLKRRLYVTSPRSQRHLTKPLSRYGLEKTGKKKPNRMIAAWHFP